MLAERWRRRFRWINWITQIFGALLGGVLSYVNFATFSVVSLGHWLADNGRVIPAGYVYLASIIPATVVFSLYVARNISIAFLLRDVVAHSRLHVLPLHPIGLVDFNRSAAWVCGINTR